MPGLQTRFRRYAWYALRLLAGLGVTVLARFSWIYLGPVYLRSLIAVATKLAPAAGLRITETSAIEGAWLLQWTTEHAAGQVRLARPLANALPFNLLVFLGLALGVSFGVFRRSPRRAWRGLACGILTIAGWHVLMLLCLILAQTRTTGSLPIRMFITVLDSLGPLLPFALWVGFFTHLSQRIFRPEMSNRPGRESRGVLSSRTTV